MELLALLIVIKPCSDLKIKIEIIEKAFQK